MEWRPAGTKVGLACLAKGDLAKLRGRPSGQGCPAASVGPARGLPAVDGQVSELSRTNSISLLTLSIVKPIQPALRRMLCGHAWLRLAGGAACRHNPAVATVCGKSFAAKVCRSRKVCGSLQRFAAKVCCKGLKKSQGLWKLHKTRREQHRGGQAFCVLEEADLVYTAQLLQCTYFFFTYVHTCVW